MEEVRDITRAHFIMAQGSGPGWSNNLCRFHMGFRGHYDSEWGADRIHQVSCMVLRIFW